jgi:hypothetical protein
MLTQSGHFLYLDILLSNISKHRGGEMEIKTSLGTNTAQGSAIEVCVVTQSN